MSSHGQILFVQRLNLSRQLLNPQWVQGLGLGFKIWGRGFRDGTLRMETQVERNMDNDMDTYHVVVEGDEIALS